MPSPGPETSPLPRLPGLERSGNGQAQPSLAEDPRLSPWLMEIPAPPEACPEILARLLEARPGWDPYLTAKGLAVLFEPGKESPGAWATQEGPKVAAGAPGTEKTLESGLAKAKEVVSQLSRGRYGEAKIKLTWRPGQAARHGALIGLGNLKLQPVAAGQASEKCNTLAVPKPLRPSPRLKACLGLAATAITEHFTPPLGAPNTKGGRVIIFDENPGLLALAALLAGAGEVEAVCSQPSEARETESLALQNGLGQYLTVTVGGPPPFPKQLAAGWLEKHDLVVSTLSPYAVTKFIKSASSWLAPGHSRLIISGPRVGAQVSLLIKAASRCGLALLDSRDRDCWSVLTLAPRRKAELPAWEWRPGDWVANLSHDELETLAELDEPGQGQALGLGPADPEPQQTPPDGD
ncbi:MAG: hypothetical protein LBU69_03045 [Deltaproteobacteria bacterium]|jgi:hypothetical protein|nr:hypothetical protein [Deltaproteobacteria bacterium]